MNEFGKLSQKVVFPVHPRTNKIILENEIKLNSNIILTKPFGYLDFIHLQSNVLKIITDSGGIQKEAYILKKPCITIRSETEWVETIETGWNILVNPTKNNFSNTIDIFEPTKDYDEIFGQNVSKKIIKILNKNE